MGATLIVHIVAGGLGLVSGYVALWAAKGARLHRRSGMVFVVVMLTMTASALAIELGHGVEHGVNVLAALLTAYLVVTALTTVRPPARGARWLDLGALLVAAAVGLTSLTFGLEALAGGGTRDGIPAFPFLLFGGIGLLATALDVRMMRAGGLRGAARLTRHLWRMCCALLIAAMSFFFGQADELPEALRVPVLLAAPVLAVLATLLYWLWRVRIRRVLRGMTLAAPAPQGGEG